MVGTMTSDIKQAKQFFEFLTDLLEKALSEAVVKEDAKYIIYNLQQIAADATYDVNRIEEVFKKGSGNNVGRGGGPLREPDHKYPMSCS